MKYLCKLCGGKGKQKGGLSCISCDGRGFFDIIGEVEECKTCKGSGRAAIASLPCISCRGRGAFFSAKQEAKIIKKKQKSVIKKKAGYKKHGRIRAAKRLKRKIK